MKIKIFIFLVLLFINACNPNSGSDLNSPEKTIATFHKAINENDIDLIWKSLTNELQNKIIGGYGSFKKFKDAQLEEDIFGIKDSSWEIVKLEKIEKNKVIVEVVYDREYPANPWELMKVNNEWFINEG
jgi:hypothetical protein